MTKVVIIGANGQLSYDLLESFAKRTGYQVSALTHEQIELTSPESIREVLTAHSPNVVINTAAYHRVDECEDQALKTFAVNTVGIRDMAAVCRDLGAKLVHFSTDYVFGGDMTRTTPYTEDDLPFPLNIYGEAKLAGEFAARNTAPNHLVIRTSGLYGVAGSSGKGGNFVELMIRLAKEGKPIKVVDDQRLAPTFTGDLAEKVIDLIEADAQGLFHVASDGNCSWFEFAQAIFELTGLTPELSPTTTESFGAKANRPRFSAMTSKRIPELGLPLMRHWREALADYLVRKGHRETVEA